MRNSGDWKETLIKSHNGDYFIDETRVGKRSILVSKQTFAVYKELIKDNARGDFLDLGCGNVPYYQIYKDQVNKVICIDWANSYHENTHLDYIADLNEDIPLEPDSVDTVLLTDVLEHIREPNHLFNQISIILRKNGRLILGVPFFYHLHEEPYDYHRYTKHKLIDFCEKNSLEVVSLKEVGGPLTVISDILAKSIPSRKLSVIFQKVAWSVLKNGWFRKFDDRKKAQFPRTYVVIAEKK